MALTAVVEPVYSSKINESRYFNPSGPVCYYDGMWHDLNGQTITITDADEADICADMS